jgi:6-phosphogluconolactonase/glucosamine-6-phosphate isomerase/deaminase
MKTKIVCINKNFSKESYSIIINEVKKNKNKIIIISGGKTIKSLFRTEKKKLSAVSGKTFVLSDERFYSDLKDKRTNYYSIKKYFISKLNKKKNLFVYFHLNSPIRASFKFFLLYLERNLAKVAFLSLGEDGHICSIFKNIKIKIKSKYLMLVKPNNKITRFTITKNYLKKIKNIYIFVKGDKKGLVLNKILKSKNSKIYPSAALNNVIYVTDKKAFNRLDNKVRDKCLKF